MTVPANPADPGDIPPPDMPPTDPGDPPSTSDAGTPLPIPDDPPGGPGGTAPAAGCADAERPARRDDSAVELCESVGSGRCWYVSSEGDDANPGTFAAPFGSPQVAVKQAAPGDVIYLRGGVYNDAHAHNSGTGRWDDPSSGIRRAFISIRTVVLPGWAGGDNYSVASGTAESPITIRSFPGERACASGAGSISVGSIRQETAYWRVEDITLHRGAINIGGGAGSASDPRNQTHDIQILRNEVYEYETAGGGNPGLVRINRGDGGGAYRITIESNILHDIIPIDPDGVTRTWSTAHDAQHFGAVTTLSCETYLGVDCGGNGELTVQNNHIYHVPQAFFLKNPAVGPFNLRGNVIHDVGSLGKWAPSNITFEENLVYGGMGGIGLGGSGGSDESDPVYERMGHNLVVRNNIFIGIRTLVQFRIFASGHTVRGNVIQGLYSMSDKSWDHMGYLLQSESWVHPDNVASITASQLATSNDFDDNCFVTEDTDFLAYGRRYDVGSGTQLDHLSISAARTTLGYELTSDIASPAEAFLDFAGGDYTVNPDGPCAGRGTTR